MKEENIKGEYQRKVDKSLIPTCNIMGVNIAAINMNWLLKYLDENLSDIKGDYICVSKGKGRIRFSCILFIIYIEILMQTAFFSREPGSRQQIDLNLFGTWGQTAIAHAYFIENIIMFIPFGLLAPMVFKRMRKVRFCVFIGFLCSCGIELSQLITQRGYCQLDDVVTNTVGMLVGWGIWKMLSSVGIAKNPLF